MPATLTPPRSSQETETRERPHRTDDGDHGGGRRPPIDKRTGGNGDGDNWNDRPQGSRGPRERLSRTRIAIFLTLSIVAMVFVALIVADLVNKVNGHISNGAYVTEWRPTAVPTVLWSNTFILLISSFFAEFARRSMFRESELMEEWLGLGRPISRRATIWLTATFAFGIAFLAGQWQAWQQIAARKAYLRENMSAKFFYLLTITHAAHLLVGIGVLAGALYVLNRSRQLVTRQLWVDSAVWYWHTMGALWLCLFLLLEFGQ